MAGNATGTKIQVVDELVIGRHAEGVGRLADDAEISRHHARIFRSGTGFLVEDLGSTNGTHVNGRRIEQPEPLGVGDEIEVGGTRMIVQFSASTPAATPAPAQDTPPATQAPPPTAKPPAEPQAPAEPPTAEAPPEPQAPAQPEPPEPRAPAQPEPPPAAPPRVSLHIELDLAAGEARVALDEGSDAVRLVFEDGRWQIVPPG